jgi:riboflavin kinase
MEIYKRDEEHRVAGGMMDPESLMVLMALAKEIRGAGEAEITLRRLSDRLGVSKQTASRRLQDLEESGMIRRITAPGGQKVGITPKGFAALRSLHRELSTILQTKPQPIELSGTVITGLGEGGYYLSQEGYLKQFQEMLGFRPYPGTLDIKLDEGSLGLREMLFRMPMEEVKGFRTEEREFGPVKFVRAKIGKNAAAVIFPARTHHSDVVELIAPVNLRKSLGLRDGSRVTVRVIA